MKSSTCSNIILASAVVLISGCGTCQPEIRYVDRPVEVKVPVKIHVDEPAKPIEPQTKWNLSQELLAIKGYIMQYKSNVSIYNGTDTK